MEKLGYALVMWDRPASSGAAHELGRGIVRVTAPNPSPMTAEGTNTYVLGEQVLAVIDPGPRSEEHLARLLSVIAERPVHAVLVTHPHLDHSPLARPLANAVGAPVMAYGSASAGRSEIMMRLAEAGFAGGGEGVDDDFVPDIALADNEVLRSADWELEAIWTPGHMGSHMSFAWGDVLFTGDHVMAWASSLVSPPDGDLTQFMASCRRLAEREDAVYLPGHGGAVTNPAERLTWLMAHRQQREDKTLAALTEPMALPALTERVYDDTPKAMHGMASRNLFAHLVDLYGRGHVTCSPLLAYDGIFSRT